jgi:hypothetical protein
MRATISIPLRRGSRPGATAPGLGEERSLGTLSNREPFGQRLRAADYRHLTQSPSMVVHDVPDELGDHHRQSAAVPRSPRRDGRGDWSAALDAGSDHRGGRPGARARQRGAAGPAAGGGRVGCPVNSPRPVGYLAAAPIGGGVNPGLRAKCAHPPGPGGGPRVHRSRSGARRRRRRGRTRAPAPTGVRPGGRYQWIGGGWYLW